MNGPKGLIPHFDVKEGSRSNLCVESHAGYLHVETLFLHFGVDLTIWERQAGYLTQLSNSFSKL